MWDMRLLVLYHAGFAHIPAILHYLTAIKHHSAHEVEYLNVVKRDEVQFSDYDAIFVNFCVVSFSRLHTQHRLMSGLIEALQVYPGMKIASVQDEYDFTNRVKAFFLDVRIDAVLTCVPPEGVKYVYSEPGFERVHFRTIQTAYLADELLEIPPDQILPLADRPIALGYRGRRLPYRLGDLGWHKSEVGLRFKAAGEAAGLHCDIEVAESQRFTGDAWLEFIRSCRVMLGSPSGANVFDFDGSLHQRMIQRYEAEPGVKYEDVRLDLSSYQGPYDMGQVSARVYEAVAQKTALALVRGGYSGVLEPDEHFVPIEPDYSNIDAVMARILDVPSMQAMADRAYEYVVGNPRNRYAHMVSKIDQLIATHEH